MDKHKLVGRMECLNGIGTLSEAHALTSISISLKRIADAMEAAALRSHAQPKL